MATEIFNGKDSDGNNEVVLKIDWSPYPGQTTINGAIFSWGGTNRLVAALIRARDETHGAPAERADRANHVSQIRIQSPL